MSVSSSGIRRVYLNDLVAAGYNFDGVDPNLLAVTYYGQPIPVRVMSPAGAFVNGVDGPAYLEYVGQAANTQYTGTSVYVLELNAAKAVRIGLNQSRLSKKPTFESSYMATTTVDRNNRYNMASPTGDPSSEVRMDSWAKRSYSFEIPVTAVAGGKSTFRLGIWGEVDFPSIPNDHDVTIALNGTTLDRAVFGGFTAYSYSGEVSNVVEGSNTVTLSFPERTAGAWDFIHVDTYSITYPRKFVAENGYLKFASAGSAFQVDGLPGPNVVVYYQQNGNLVRVTNVQTQANSNGTFVAIFPGVGSLATYHVINENSVQTPGLEPMLAQTDITFAGQTVEYVVIAHPSFLANADLGQLVSQHGAKLVDVNQVYLLKSGANFDPNAIKQYIADLAAKNGLKYVLLVGGDTYNYRQFTSDGSVSFIPSLYAATDSLVKFAPADPLYGDVNGDNVQDIALGRIPPRTNGELSSAIRKILKYMDGAYSGAVLAADNGFAADSELFASYLRAGWNVTRAYVSDAGVTAARQTLIDGINQGAAVTSYFGHSDATQWTFGGLFTAANTKLLTNSESPTVVTQWGCWNNYYVAPQFNTLAHKFLFPGDPASADYPLPGGAAAVFGASTIATDSSERALGILFIDSS